MASRKTIFRLIGIQRVLVKYGLDDVIKEMHLLRPLRFLFYLAPRRRDSSAPLGERIRLALEELAEQRQLQFGLVPPFTVGFRFDIGTEAENGTQDDPENDPPPGLDEIAHVQHELADRRHIGLGRLQQEGELSGAEIEEVMDDAT